MKKILAVILSLIVFGVAGALAYNCYKQNHNRKSAEKTVTAFVDSANDQNINKMLEYIEPTEAQLISFGISKLDEATDSETFSKLKKWLPYISDVTDLQVIPQFDVSVKNSEINDNNADVTAILTNKKSNAQTECVFKLIKIESKWYLQYVTVN